MFEHFGQRLKRDLKQIVDSRIMNSETMSGSLMKVRQIRIPTTIPLTNNLLNDSQAVWK